MKRLAIFVRVLCAGGAAAGFVALALAPVGAQSPTLGEVAKKEAERRKAQPPAGKVYSNKDLPPSAQKPAAPATGAGTQTTIPLDPVAAVEKEKGKEEAKPDAETRDEAWWRGRVAAVREEIRRNEMFAEALQTRINSLGRDFVNRDNPVQRARIGEDRASALSELGRVKTEIDRGRKQIEDIEEEARKAGVPPGWLR